MSRYLTSATLAAALALSVAAAAQTQPAGSASPAQTPAASAGTVTIEGCLMREDDVPGRKANVAERVGMGEDFVLTATKIVKGSAPSGTGAVGTSGTTSGAMYDVNGIDDDTMRKFINRRVQVDGTFDNLDAKGDELIEIRATAIRPGTGECPPN